VLVIFFFLRLFLFAARNALLVRDGAGDLRLKLCDFGLSVVVGNGDSFDSSNRLLPIRWMALEVFSEARYRRASEVWSWGIVVWEMFSMGRIPYDDFTSNQDVIQFVAEGNRLPLEGFAPAEPAEFGELVRQSWDADAEKCPAFEHLARRCRVLAEELDDPDAILPVFQTAEQDAPHTPLSTADGYADAFNDRDEFYGAAPTPGEYSTILSSPVSNNLTPGEHEYSTHTPSPVAISADYARTPMDTSGRASNSE
jgi:serine/threonine protein kinase